MPKGEYSDERVMNFGALRPSLPAGWMVIQLDSGHYLATNGEVDSVITWDLYRARRWAFQLAQKERDDHA